jgi:hypothetical protein
MIVFLSRHFCNQFLSSVLLIQHNYQAHTPILFSSTPIFRHVDVHCTMSAYSTNFINPISVC